jgi:Flp pilus assembly protein CpaB
MARPAWLNARTILGALLFILAFLTGQRVLEGSRTTVSVWSAARDLPADTRLSTEDVARADVRLPGDLLGRYVVASRDLEGAVLTRLVRAGELVPSGALAEEATGPGRAITIPVTPEHSLGALVSVGDRVDVFATFDAEDVRARTFPIVRSAEVVDVVTASGFVSEGASVVGVTVAVTPQEAVRLAFSIRAGEIDLARVVGATTAEQATTVRADDLR